MKDWDHWETLALLALLSAFALGTCAGGWIYLDNATFTVDNKPEGTSNGPRTDDAWKRSLFSL